MRLVLLCCWCRRCVVVSIVVEVGDVVVYVVVGVVIVVVGDVVGGVVVSVDVVLLLCV